MALRRSIACATALLLAALLVAPRLVAAADDIFVLVDGIPGDVKRSDHQGWIQAYAVGNRLATAEPGARTTFSDLSILKGIDSASPLLLLAAARAQIQRTVDVEFVHPGEAPFTYFKMRISNVLVSGVRTNANAVDASITEFVTFRYDRISWEYTPQRSDGTPGAKVSGCWDLTQNKAC